MSNIASSHLLHKSPLNQEYKQFNDCTPFNRSSRRKPFIERFDYSVGHVLESGSYVNIA